jgi:hypothetical protein
MGLAVTASAGGDFLVHFEDGAAIVDETKYIGYDGVEKTLPEGWEFYDPYAYTFGEMTYHDGVGVVVKEYEESGEEHVFGAVNGQGKLLFQVTAEDLGAFGEGLAPICQDGKWGLIDKTGKLILAPVLDAERVYALAEGMLLFVQNEKYGFADVSGKIVVPAKYDGADAFSEGLASVTRGYNSGYIDKTGALALPMQYGNAMRFSEGLAAVNDSFNRGDYYYIDKSGAVVIPGPFGTISDCVDGLMHTADRKGFMDKTGTKVISLPDGYHADGDFHEGLARIVTDDYGSASFIDKTGRVVLDQMSPSTSDFSEGYAVYKRHDKLFSLGVIKNPLSAPQTAVAAPTSSTVLVNGENAAFDADNIGGNNYFKLRDLAYTLSGTEKQFEVGWDDEANAISLTSGQVYTAVGGEMDSKGAGNKTATPTASKITLDGNDVAFDAYNIGGNNYFKLRDLGAAFDFGITWDGDANTIVIDTGKGYEAEYTAKT